MQAQSHNVSQAELPNNEFGFSSQFAKRKYSQPDQDPKPYYFQHQSNQVSEN